MWVARVRFSVERTLIGSLASQYGVTLFLYPLSFSYDRGVIVHVSGTLFGERKEGFVRALKRQPRVLDFEIKNDFFIGTIKEKEYCRDIYRKEIIFVEPAIISTDEIATVGCFDKKPLEGFVKVLEKKYSGKLLSLKKRKLGSITVMRMTELTKRQKEAVNLALKHGYYKVPREVDVKDLAKMVGLSFSTFQVHLRKAEGKLMPYFNDIYR